MQVLPFYRFQEQISLNHRTLYNTSGNREFKLVTRSNELLPFVCPLPKNWDSNFSIIVRSFPEGKQVFRLGPIDLTYRILKKPDGSLFLVFDGGPVGCMDLGPCTPYYLDINKQYSEVFYTSRDPYSLLKFTLSNPKNVAGLPYGNQFSQWFYTFGHIDNPEYVPFRVSKQDEKGNITVSYSKLTPSYEFNFREVPPNIQAVFASMNLVASVEVSDIFQTITANTKGLTVKTSDKVSQWATVTLTLPDINEASTKACDMDTFVEDTSYQIGSPIVCAPPSGIGGFETLCSDIFGNIGIECLPVEPDFGIELVR